MGQLARLETEISRTAGAWPTTAGGSLAAEVDETLRDGTTTEFASPNTIATHIAKLAFGANWDGAALARPWRNDQCVLSVDARFIVGLIFITIKLVEDVAGNGYATVRDTWGPLGGLLATYQIYRRALAAAVVDSIQDFTKLGLQFEIQVGNVGRAGAISYAALEMPSPGGLTLGLYQLNFAGVVAMPRCFELFTINNTVPAQPIVNNRFDCSANGFVLIVPCHAVDLVADSYAEVKCAVGWNNTLTATAGFIRQVPTWVSPGVDSLRYDMVPDAAFSRWDLKVDGGASVSLNTTPFATVPNLVAGDRTQTRAVGNNISGRKNGVQITAAVDATIPNAGHPGFVLSPSGAGPWIGIDYFEAGSTTAPSTNAFRGHGLTVRLGLALS